MTDTGLSLCNLLLFLVGIACLSVFGCDNHDDLIAYWTLDEHGGDSIRDSSPSSFNGIAHNALVGQGVKKSCRYFHSTGSRIDIPGFDLSGRVAELTLVIWVGMDDSHSGNICVNYNDRNGSIYTILEVEHDSKNQRIGLQSGPIDSVVSYAADTVKTGYAGYNSSYAGFRQVVMTYEYNAPIRVKWYVNAIPVGATKTSHAEDRNWGLGHGQGIEIESSFRDSLSLPDRWIGVDEIMIFNRALSAFEIEDLFMDVRFYQLYKGMLMPVLDKGWYAKSWWKIQHSCNGSREYQGRVIPFVDKAWYAKLLLGMLHPFGNRECPRDSTDTGN